MRMTRHVWQDRISVARKALLSGLGSGRIVSECGPICQFARGIGRAQAAGRTTTASPRNPSTLTSRGLFQRSSLR